MGLDGVVPGTAYTLMTAADSSFAVDLVQNLNLSSQQVPKKLLELAEKDPKWSRVRHIPQGDQLQSLPTVILSIILSLFHPSMCVTSVLTINCEFRGWKRSRIRPASEWILGRCW